MKLMAPCRAAHTTVQASRAARYACISTKRQVSGCITVGVQLGSFKQSAVDTSMAGVWVTAGSAGHVDVARAMAMITADPEQAMQANRLGKGRSSEAKWNLLPNATIGGIL